MKVRDIAALLNAELETGDENLEMDVFSACGADLMSDVMAFVKGNVLLLTGLVHPQVIRTAEMMDIKAIALVRGKKPDELMCRLAREKGITLLSTRETMFTACGKLYKAGLTGGGGDE